MNIITSTVRYSPSFSSKMAWSAYAIINDQRTTVSCMHNHSRQDLAEKCAAKYFNQITTPMINAELIDMGDGLWEARWTNERNTTTTRRFRFIEESNN